MIFGKFSGLMNPSSFQKGFSRAIQVPKNGAFARISRFDSDAEKLIPKDSERVENERDDSGIDYDSCISPTATAASRARIEFGSTNLDTPSLKVRSWAEASSDDYDSCLSPTGVPRWSVNDLEMIRERGRGASFKELHKLLMEGCITHFSACPTKGRTRLEVSPKIEPKTVIMAGSFNPLHHGHEELAKRAATEAPGANGKFFFEISTVNVDKGPISASDMEKRVIYITRKGHCCILSNALLFDAKAELYPNCIFAIGFDTYTRVVDPKYYPRVTGGIEATMARIEAKGYEFYVGGRLTEDGKFTSLGGTPETLVDSFDNLDDTTFNDDEYELVELPPAAPYRGKSTCLIQKDNEGKELKFCSEEPASPIFSGFKGFRHDVSSTDIRSAGFLLPEVDPAFDYAHE